MSEFTEKKKKAQQKRNKKAQHLFHLMRLRKQDAERVENEANARKPKRSDKSSSKDDPLWSEKVSTIRDRVSGKKRTSKERWNRFAGTEGGGGRGL